MRENSLQAKIKQAVIDAMRAKDKPSLSIARVISAEIKNLEKIKDPNSKIALTEEEILTLLMGMIKKREDSIAHFLKAKRDDLVAIEKNQIDLLNRFLPEQMSIELLSKLVKEHIKAIDAKSMADIPKVLALLKPKILGKAKISDLMQILKKNLNAS